MCLLTNRYIFIYSWSRF